MRLPVAGQQDHDQRENAPVAQRAEVALFRRAPALRHFIAAIIALASLAWLWHSVEVESVWPLLQRAHPPALVLAVGLLGASLAVKSLRWRSLLPGPRRIGRLEAYRIFHISILLNNLLPFRVGDGARVLSPAVRRSATAQQALVVLLAERALDAVALALAAAITMPLFLTRTGHPLDARFAGAPFGDIGGAPLFGIAGALAATGIIATRAARAPEGRLRRWLRTRIASLRADIASTLHQHPRHLATVGAWTALAWTGTFLLHYALLEALDAPRVLVAPIVLAVAVTLTTNLSMLAPTTPAGIGIFHAAAAAPLMAAGFASEVAVAYALLVHAVNTVPPMLVGAAFLGGPLAGRLRPRPAAG